MFSRHLKLRSLALLMVLAIESALTLPKACQAEFVMKQKPTLEYSGTQRVTDYNGVTHVVSYTMKATNVFRVDPGEPVTRRFSTDGTNEYGTYTYTSPEMWILSGTADGEGHITRLQGRLVNVRYVLEFSNEPGKSRVIEFEFEHGPSSRTFIETSRNEQPFERISGDHLAPEVVKGMAVIRFWAGASVHVVKDHVLPVLKGIERRSAAQGYNEAILEVEGPYVRITALQRGFLAVFELSASFGLDFKRGLTLGGEFRVQTSDRSHGK